MLEVAAGASIGLIQGLLVSSVDRVCRRQGGKIAAHFTKSKLLTCIIGNIAGSVVIALYILVPICIVKASRSFMISWLVAFSVGGIAGSVLSRRGKGGAIRLHRTGPRSQRSPGEAPGQFEYPSSSGGTANPSSRTCISQIGEFAPVRITTWRPPGKACGHRFVGRWLVGWITDNQQPNDQQPSAGSPPQNRSMSSLWLSSSRWCSGSAPSPPSASRWSRRYRAP